MDCTVEWKVSSDVETLVEAIAECKRELTKACFAKCGRANAVLCNVYASDKLLQLLKLAPTWKQIITDDEHARNVRIAEKDPLQKFWHFGDVGDFHVNRSHLCGDNYRLIIEFDIDDVVPVVWFGDVAPVAKT